MQERSDRSSVARADEREDAKVPGTVVLMSALCVFRNDIESFPVLTGPLLYLAQRPYLLPPRNSESFPRSQVSRRAAPHLLRPAECCVLYARARLIRG